MSELSRGVLAGTEQVSRAYSGLANLHAVNRERKRRAMSGIGDSIAELEQTIKDYGSWRDAKKAEDETRQVDDAYALGMQTGEPEKALVTLGAVRPTTAAAATLRAKRMEDATEGARKRNEARLNEAMEFQREQRYREELKNTQEQTVISRAQLELAKTREARLGAETPNIDPLSPAGVAAAEEKARRVAEAEAGVKAKYPAAPKDLDQPIDDPEALETVLQLTPGSLKGKSYRFYHAALDAAKAAAAREGNDLNGTMKQLRITLDKMNIQEKDPRVRKLMAAQKVLDQANKDLADFKTQIAMTSFRTPLDPTKISARQAELEAGVTSARGAVTAAEAEAATPALAAAVESQQGAAPAAKLAMPEGMPPEVQASWPKWTDAQRQQFLDELKK